MKVIAISNFKGGTGKTATCVNLAAILAADGQRVLLTMTDRTNLSRQGAEHLRRAFPARAVFDQEIRSSVKVGESSCAHEPLIEYAPGCSAAADYRALAKEVLSDAEHDR